MYLRLCQINQAKLGCSIALCAIDYKLQPTLKMIQINSMVQCADNSGAKDIMCIQVLKNQRQFGSSVCLFRGVVKSTVKNSEKIKKSELVLCLLISTKKKKRNIQFSSNRCILLKPNFEPVATRVFGPIAIAKNHPGFSKFFKNTIFDVSKA